MTDIEHSSEQVSFGTARINQLKMRVFVILLAVACAMAEPEPQFPYYPLRAISQPYYTGYHSLAYDPLVRAGYPYASYVTPYQTVGLKSQYNNQDIFGQASYGHVEPGQSHHAVQDVAGNKIGSFSYYNPEGKLIQTNYVADAGGYRVASNDLPVAPVHHAALPAPPADTPEVAAAKIAHLAEIEKVKFRGRRQVPVIPALYPTSVVPLAYRYGYPHAYPTTQTVPKVKPDGFLEETPEVALAKANHFAQVAAASHNHYATVAARTPYYYPFWAFK